MRIFAFPATPVIALSATLALTLGLAGCASTGGPTPSPTPAATPTSAVAGPLATAQARAQFHIMVGTMAADQQRPKKAAEQFLAATREVPDTNVAAQAVALAMIADDASLALAAAHELAKQKPDDPRVLGALLELSVRNDEVDAAFDAGRKLLKHSSGGLPEAYHSIAGILSQTDVLRHAKAATQVMTKLVALHPDLAAAHSASSLLALRQHDSDAAEADARHALALAPTDSSAALLLIAALIQQGQVDQAGHVLAPVMKRLPGEQRRELRFGYAQMLFKYGRYEHARTALLNVLKSEPKNNDALLLLGEVDLRLHRLDEATKTLARIPSGNAQRDAMVQYYLGRIAETRRDFLAALKHYKRALGSGMGPAAGLQQAQVLSRMGQPDKANELLAQLAQTYPSHAADIIAVQSQVLLQEGKTAQALAVVDQAIQKLPDNDDLIYQRALIYDHAGRADDAEAALRQLVARHPHDPRYLNGLGFVLAEHNDSGNLDEAHKLIASALHMRPDNPAMMDSMGWVLYRQGHASQALPYLRRAYALFDDPEIAAHLVTVLAATGDADAARHILDQALARDPGNRSLEKAAQALHP